MSNLARVAWWILITARQFIQNPTIWVKKITSPGGQKHAARRFLTRTQEQTTNTCAPDGFEGLLGGF